MTWAFQPPRTDSSSYLKQEVDEEIAVLYLDSVLLAEVCVSRGVAGRLSALTRAGKGPLIW